MCARSSVMLLRQPPAVEKLGTKKAERALAEIEKVGLGRSIGL